MFQIKDFASIVAGMLNHMRGATDKITDYNVGSVARTMVEAPAVEMDELYQQMFIGLKEAIPVSVFNTFNFTKLKAQYATGMITFSADPAHPAVIIIPTGTVVRVPGAKMNYVTQAIILLPVGAASVDVYVIANAIGSVGNIAAGTITELVGTIAGVTSVINQVDISSGMDDETDDERKIRFQAYISTLQRGTNAAIVYGAKTATVVNGSGQVTEVVAHAVIIEPYLADNTQPPSVISCVIHNGVGATSPALVAAAQNIINGYALDNGAIAPGWKAAGVICTVVAATEVAITITGALTVLKGYDGAAVRTAALIAAQSYVQSLPIGTTMILNELVAAIMAIDGIYNVHLTAPAADAAITNVQKPMPNPASALTWTQLP